MLARYLFLTVLVEGVSMSIVKLETIAFLFFGALAIPLVADDQDNKGAIETKAVCDDVAGCNARLLFTTLCAEKIKTGCVDANQINTGALCTALANILNLNSNAACFSNLCVDSLKTNSLQQCGSFRATAVYSTNTNYTLGTPLLFDTILDDPNGDFFNKPCGRIHRSCFRILCSYGPDGF